MKIRHFVLGALILAGIALASHARAEERVNWTGLYLGANAQYVWVNQGWPGADPYPAGPPTQDLSGAMLGGTVGYNQQFGALVLGVEGDFDFGSLNDSKRDGNYIIEKMSIDKAASIRGRVGWAIGSVLPYITGGVAFENLEYGESCPEPAAAPFGWCNKHGSYNLSKSQWNTGYVVGGGVEWMATSNISMKIEGLYTDLGSSTYELGDMGDGKPLPKKTIDHDEATIRLGVNYHF